MAKKVVLTNTELKVVRGIREKGYAVAIFTDDELDGVPSDDVEDAMVSAGWDAIDNLKEEAVEEVEDDEDEDDK